MARVLLLLVCLALSCGAGRASPIVDLLPAESPASVPEMELSWGRDPFDMSLDHASDSKQADLVCWMDDAPPLAHRISWSMYVHYDDGLLPDWPLEVCMPANWDSCCNMCNGFLIFGVAVPSMPGVYQYGYAGVPCTGVCGTGDCDGTTSGVFTYFHVKPDTAYWSGQPPGTYYREVALQTNIAPNNMNLWTCCGGESGIECSNPEYPFERLGYHIGESLTVRITVPLLDGGFAFGRESRSDVLPPAGMSVEDAIAYLMEPNPLEGQTWGWVKSRFR